MNTRLPLFLRSLAVLLFLASPVLLQAKTLNVPSAAYPTIQSGVDAASDGDTVLVADGTYTGRGNRDIDFRGNSLTVTSQNGPTKTIIDCGGYDTTDGSGNHRGFYLHTGERAATINGFTVKSGCEKYISGRSKGMGGGINDSNDGSSNNTFTNCVVSGNTSEFGGGISIDNRGKGKNTIINCTVSGNTAKYGGGIYIHNIDSGMVTFTSCVVSGNTAEDGGGIDNFNANEGNNKNTFTNCIISGNTAKHGGGIYNYNLDLGKGRGKNTFTNCVVSGNTAEEGGGVYIEVGTVTFTNDILYGDNGGEVIKDNKDSVMIFTTASLAIANNCDIQDGYLGTSIINADPQFVNASAGDFRLKPGSPCFGAGTSGGAPATDKDGTRRPKSPSIGAYEPAATSRL